MCLIQHVGIRVLFLVFMNGNVITVKYMDELSKEWFIIQINRIRDVDLQVKLSL